ncbi:MAG: winged helix-turn-helix transcriptional regulator [Actinomycetota bacterium]
MRRVSFEEMNCSVARTLEVVGEWWTLLILRDAFRGVRRFEEFQARLGIARNILTTRLQTLVRHGLMERQLYEEHPPRYEYRLTPEGEEIFPVIAGLLRWGDRFRAGPAGSPVVLIHEGCGHQADPVLVCSHCGQPVAAGDMRTEPGPGAGGAGVTRDGASAG